MPNPRRAKMSFGLKPATKKSLAQFAKSRGRSSDLLVSDVVESFVADQNRMIAEARAAERDVAAGHYIKHEDMKAWLLSWGTDNELPPPKCVCGKDHPEKSR
jgi:predicted transcriptional regulator